jgi:benzoyl-CoA reductase subunit A
MTQEYWKWPESSWVSDTIDWKKAKNITAGVDIGTTSSQAAIVCEGELFGYANIRTGADFKEAADSVIEQAMGSSGMKLEDIGSIAATGFGRRNASYASKMLDDIHCQAKGARFMFGPSVKTVVDLGGQTTKAIRLYDWDRVRDFKLNDKCATGMGRNIEIVCDILQVPIEEIGEKSLAVEKDREPVSTTCYAFAESETFGLFRPPYREEPYSENEVYATYLFAVAWRIMVTIGKLSTLDIGDIRLDKELAFTGGLAKNVGITKRLERELNMTALTSDYDPQLAGAIGAALLA